MGVRAPARDLPAALDALPPYCWTSLELRRVAHAVFSPDPRKAQRWLVEFPVAGLFGPRLQITLTDPVATATLNVGGTLPAQCLLTLSLTAPIAFPQYDLPPRCYKLAAGVIAL